MGNDEIRVMKRSMKWSAMHRNLNVNRAVRFAKLPDGYRCYKCNFSGPNCDVCNGLDVQPIPFSELKGRIDKDATTRGFTIYGDTRPTHY